MRNVTEFLRLNQIEDGVFVAGALAIEHMADLAKRGIKTIINVRVDGEHPEQVAGADAMLAAGALGLAYVHIPASPYDVFTDQVVDAAARTFASAAKPVVIHCAVGQRAAIVWAAAAARSQPVEMVLARLANAGFELDFLRDDLDAQADRARWRGPVDTERPVPPAADAPVPVEADKQQAA